MSNHEVQLHNSVDLDHLLAASLPAPDEHLGELLVAQGLVTNQELEAALAKQGGCGGLHLGEVLVGMGVVSRQQVTQALAEKFGIPSVRLENFQVPPAVLNAVPADVALQYNILPLGMVKGRLVVAMENPMDWEALSAIRFNANCMVDAVLAPARDISAALDQFYSRLDDASLDEDLQLKSAVVHRESEAEKSATSMEQEAMKTPVVRLLNAILLQAVTRGASDINIRPEKDRVNVYYRIDGALQFIRTLPKAVLPGLVSRVKITGQMNIAERRLPQDGHAKLVRNHNVIDLRISVVPTVNGESVVIRILDKEAGLRKLDELGFAHAENTMLRQLLSRSFGIFLVTGPTGSGKSTTLYSLINEIKQRDPHIVTVEDPVEYHVDGVEQIQVSIPQGYTFAEALRHILRHDPDVVMVGEIRDAETAHIATKAALTGHLVLSTLHTNDAASAITRLTDMGIEPYLISDTLLGVMAQRLVRLNCQHCLEDEVVAPEIRDLLQVDEAEVFRQGRGCGTCNYTGYLGRVAVCELLPVTGEVVAAINSNQSARAIKEVAVSQGMKPLTENALTLAREGKTSLEEVFTVRIE